MQALLVFALFQNTGPTLPLAYDTYKKKRKKEVPFLKCIVVSFYICLCFPEKKNTLQGVLVLQLLGCVLSASFLCVCT